jgi:kynureninase
MDQHAISYIREVADQNEISDLTSLELAQHLDNADKLRHLRSNFHIPKMGTLPEGVFHISNFVDSVFLADQSLVNPNEDSIYLCGNSLGLLPKATKGFLDEQLTKWAEM